MNHTKIGIGVAIVLLVIVGSVFILQGSVSPTGSATTISPEKVIKTNENITISAPDKNIYTYLGIMKPVVPTGPNWQTYASSKNEVDDLLIKSGNRDNVKNVIGYLKGTDEKIVLYSGIDGNKYGLIYKDGKISSRQVNNMVLGTKVEQNEDAYSKEIPLDNNNKSVHSTHYELSRISLSDIGSSEFSTMSVDSVHISRTDSWIYLGTSIASLYTDGTFTYDGIQILSIDDNSNTYQDLGFDQCSFSHSTRVTGITGYIDSSIIWSVYMPMPPKHSVNAWISCNIYGSTDGNSVTSDWVASGFSCFGTP